MATGSYVLTVGTGGSFPAAKKQVIILVSHHYVGYGVRGAG
jgi:hypothetical protein